MIKGILVYNGFLKDSKYSTLHTFVVETAKKKNIELTPKSNIELMACIYSNKNQILGLDIEADFILFWDKDVRLAQALESIGLRVFNNSKAIEVCDDKSLTHLFLSQSDIPMPKTIICPKTFQGVNYNNISFIKKVIEELSFPMIVKESFGSFGKQVYLVHSESEIISLLDRLQYKPLIFQEYIKSSHGRDVRIQIVGGKEVASMYRYSTSGDFRANVSNGGHMKPYIPSDAQIKMAVKACDILGLDFGGVDLLFGENDETILCEVNSNAHIINIYDCTHVNVADAIFDHIMRIISK